MNHMSASSFTPSERAARLYAYIAQKHAHFSIEGSLRVVADVEPYWHEPTKSLVKRVRAALAAEGVTIAHESGLQATAKLQGYSDYFHVPKDPPALEILVHSASSQMRPVADWRACASILTDTCKSWLEANRTSRLLRLEVSPNVLCIYGMLPGLMEEGGVSDPIAIVRPLVAGTWLEGAASALETLRRFVEESQRATLDGLALMRYCSTRDKAALPYSLWGGSQVADVPYSELVLMRKDHEFDAGYEIVRGDEVACWQQLLIALEGYEPTDIAVDEVGAWDCGGARFEWEVATLRPHDVVPGLAVANLPTDESSHLLRRFQAAVRARNAEALQSQAPKRIAAIDGPPTHCKLDAHRVLRALKERDETWEMFCASMGAEPQPLTKPVEIGIFLMLAEHLSHADPASLLLRPTRTELAAVHDDQLLRALMPRVNHLRYRIVAGLDVSQRAAVQEAVQEFSTSIALRNGFLPMEPSLPDVVYAGDGEELRVALENVGLVMFVGLMPFLKLIPDEVRQQYPQLGPYAYGTSLYVDIDLAV